MIVVPAHGLKKRGKSLVRHILHLLVKAVEISRDDPVVICAILDLR